MTEHQFELVVSVPSEVEAAAIVSVLAEQGIAAKATGGLTAGFRAEAPGEVGILVAVDDLPRATEILDEFHAEPEPSKEATGPVIVTCDSCGKQSTFPADTRGTIQSCPECAAFLDVP